MAVFPSPTGGASLILSFRLVNKTVLIIGSGPLAASRAFAALEADSSVVVLSNGGADAACEELKWRAQQGQITVLDLDTIPGSSGSNKIEAFGSYLLTNPGISLVCVTDTIIGSDSTPDSHRISAEGIHQLCKARNIPVNVTDMPDLCDFSFTTTHRFLDPVTGGKTALQVGVTTNGRGCRLAGRLRRDIVARLPQEAGPAVEKVGALRALAKAEAEADRLLHVADDETSEYSGVSTPNLPVPSRKPAETSAESTRRRMKWVAQVSEYWPLERLARISEAEMQMVLSAGEEYASQSDCTPPNTAPPSCLHSLVITPPQPCGRILLVGSGPGHPGLLTLATHNALTKQAQLILSDKLVPAAVLALIPKEVDVRIARKFPGNADGAQTEMMEAAVEAAKRGLIVVRLKQGDPAVYGRVGEEILYFRSHGFEPLVIPGVSSALAGPTFSGISVTQRGAAEAFVVCTGVGRKGKEVELPGYERGKTVVVLMGVARLGAVVTSLLDTGSGSRRNGEVFPRHTPVALIERASMPDQRVIESTLGDVEAALESVGEQRPPGMLVIGWTVLALWGKGDVSVLDEDTEGDAGRVQRWLGGDQTRWRVKEGLPSGWDYNLDEFRSI